MAWHVSLSVLSAMGIGLAPTMHIATTAGLIMGTANGYANIMLITWLQQKVASEVMRRIMSLVMFAAIGLNPISTALAGALIGLNTSVLLVCAGILMTLFTFLPRSAPLLGLVCNKRAHARLWAGRVDARGFSRIERSP